MKTPLHILLTLLTFAAFIPALHADVTGRTEDSSLAGTEKILSDSSGANTFFTVNTLFGATRTLVSPVISTGLTASGSASNDFSASTGAFQTSSGLNTFNGSGHAFAAVLYPGTNDGAALGDATHNFSDMFLASGALINWANGNVLLTHSSGVLTLGTGNFIITTAGTATGSVVTNNGTQTLAAKTLTSPVIATGLTASGSASNDFSASTGTFKTSTGVNTFGGSTHTFAGDVKPATDGTGNLGTAALSWDNLYLDTLASINIDNGNWAATHTSGILTVGTGDFRVTTAGTNTASVVTVGGTQTLTAKTLTSPTIAGPSISGTSAFTGAITTTGALTQTSSSATAFSSGPNGGTNPVFRLVNNVSSAATGISITGRAATAGADITVLSSGTNEPLNIEAKGSGSILLNGTATGAVYVGDRTTPALSVVHTTEGTGVAVTSAAAASGVAVTATSSGTNENMTLDAKGSGTLTLNGTATGATIIGNGRVTPSVQTITGDGAITVQSGVVLLTKGSAAAVTLAAPSSQDGTVIEITSTTDFAHVVTVTGGLWDGTATTNTTITFPVVAGGAVRIIAFGTDWYVLSNQGTTIAP